MTDPVGENVTLLKLILGNLKTERLIIKKCILVELKPLVLKGKVLGEKF